MGAIPPHGETETLARPPVTWFLVADGARAQVYTRQHITARIPLAGNSRHRHYEERHEQELVPVTGMRWEAPSPNDYELGNDLLGRVFESASPTRHMASPHVDIREDLKLRFMRTIASQLTVAKQHRQFDRLVLIAPPKLLGELKRQLSPAVLDHVVAELPKELTRYEARDLKLRLGEII